ncbi:MAG: Sua5 family C-terminal domain-containing protein, partial [Myxococcota bacterium]
REVGQVVQTAPTDPGEAPQSPGRLSRHYAPGTPLTLVDDLEAPPPGPSQRVALLRVLGDVAPARRAFEAAGHTVVEARSLAGPDDLSGAARELFAGLRALDDSGADALFAERCPRSEGLGFAIRDRLERASTRR